MKFVFLFVAMSLLTFGLIAAQADRAPAAHPVGTALTDTPEQAPTVEQVSVPQELQLNAEVAAVNCGPRLHWCQCGAPNQACSGCAPRPSPCDGFCQC